MKRQKKWLALSLVLLVGWYKESACENVWNFISDDKTPLSLLKDDHIAYVQGYPEGAFGQERSITRAEVVTLVNAILKRKVSLGDTLSS